MTERIVVLVDMDCFYVQVEERQRPHIRGKPAAVVQYNSWRGGGIIAVNYEAREFGVRRGMRGDQAREKCPGIELVQVPVSRGKADLTKYRDAGKEVIDVLVKFRECIERASIDEAYLDLTIVVEERMAEMEGADGTVNPGALPSTWVVGYDNDGQDDREAGLNRWRSRLYGAEEMKEDRLIVKDNLKLAVAAAYCEEMRHSVFEKTTFKCSAGIAHNKMLAKLSCGLHKPNQQTVMPHDKVAVLWDGLPVGKVRNLGGKLGDSLTENLGCVTMGDLSKLSLRKLTVHYDHKTAHWLYSLGQGIDTEPVTARQLPKSIGCGKNFQGRETLDTPEKVHKWTRSLADELSERLEADRAANKRNARTLTVGIRLDGEERLSSLTRSCRLPSYQAEDISRVALSLFTHTNVAKHRDNVWFPSIKHISLSASKFEDAASTGSANIQEMFKRAVKKASTSSSFSSSTASTFFPSSQISSNSFSLQKISRTTNFPSSSITPSTSFLSPKTPSISSYPSKSPSNTSFPSFKSSSSIFPSCPLTERVEEEEDSIILDNSEIINRKSDNFKINNNQAGYPKSIVGQSKVSISNSHNPVSFPSQVGRGEEGGSGSVYSRPTNSFFKNFLLKKYKVVKEESYGCSDGTVCDESNGDGKEGHSGRNYEMVISNVNDIVPLNTENEGTELNRSCAEIKMRHANSSKSGNERTSGKNIDPECVYSCENSYINSVQWKRMLQSENEDYEGKKKGKIESASSSEDRNSYQSGNSEEGADVSDLNHCCYSKSEETENSSIYEASPSYFDKRNTMETQHKEGTLRIEETKSKNNDKKNTRKIEHKEKTQISEKAEDQNDREGKESNHLIVTEDSHSSYSQELFSSWEVEKCVERMRKRSTPSSSSSGKRKLIPSERESRETQYLSATRSEEQCEGSSKQSAKECSVLVKELFPDLNNIDASLLPLLPREIRMEVEKELTTHTTTYADQPKNTTDNNNKSGILKFIHHTNRNFSSNPQHSATQDLVECQECHKWVSAFDLPEHLDYHVALKLQNDLRRECDAVTGTVSKHPTTTDTPTGRGKKKGRPSRLQIDAKKIYKLDSFFTR